MQPDQTRQVFFFFSKKETIQNIINENYGAEVVTGLGSTQIEIVRKLKWRQVKINE